MTHLSDSPEPLDPLQSRDPVLQQVREALQRQDASLPVRSLADARTDLDVRLGARDAGRAHDAGDAHDTRNRLDARPEGRARRVASGLSTFGLGRAWSRTQGFSWGSGGIAAVLVVGVAAGLWFGRTRVWRTFSRSTPVVYASYATRDGQIAHLTLDDGSRVTLAPNTTLGVSRGFATRRDITVRGEAYFDVARQATPFVVHTGSVATRVLGTSFDVRRYPSDSSVRVAVVSGKVSVTGRYGVTLAAGELGRVSDSTFATKSTDGVTAATGWVAGTLAFREVPASELLDAVGHWYGLEFDVTDSALVRRPVVATLVSGETRADALELISKVLNVTMTFTDTNRGVTIVTLRPARGDGSAHVAPSERRVRREPFPVQTPEVGR